MGIREMMRRYGVRYTAKKIANKLYTGYIAGRFKYNRKISSRVAEQQKSRIFSRECLFSIVVPLYNTDEIFLREMVESVRAQTYGRWQLCMADGSDAEHGYVREICGQYAAADARICYKKLKENKGISENTNACIDMAEGDYIGLFDHDDLLHPSALYKVMDAIEKEGADFVYTDEATFSGSEAHLLSVHRKPGFSFFSLRANNYVCHFTVFKKELLKKSGMFRREYDGSQDHDMILRLCEQAENIVHVPEVLYFWRAHENSVALDLKSKSYALDAGVRAVKSHLARMGLRGGIDTEEEGMIVYRVHYEHGFQRSDVEVVRNGGRGLEPAGKKFVLLLDRQFETPDDESICAMLACMADNNVKAVTGVTVDKKGKIISGGTYEETDASEAESASADGYVNIRHKFKNAPYGIPGYMMQLRYAAGIPAICSGVMLLRAEDADNMPEERLFEMAEWTRQSLEWKKQGYELVCVPWAKISVGS